MSQPCVNNLFIADAAVSQFFTKDNLVYKPFEILCSVYNM